MHKLRAFLPAVVLLAGCAFIARARSQAAVPLAGSLQAVLSNLPGYRFDVQHLSDEERRVAGMSDYVARVYSRDTVPVFSILVSYYERQTQGQTIHSPRNCLPGAGWEVMTAGTRPVTVNGAVVTLNRYVIKNQASTAVVYYWYQGRGRVVANEYAVKWNLLRDAALSGHTEEALVRVVVPIRTPQVPRGASPLEPSFAAADSLGADIAARLARDVDLALPRASGSARLVGSL
jgi:EpsI family protein